MKSKLERAKEKQHNQKVCLKIFSRPGDTGLEFQLLVDRRWCWKWNLGPHARQGLDLSIILAPWETEAQGWEVQGPPQCLEQTVSETWVNTFVALYSVRIYKFTGDISVLGWSLPSGPLISFKTRIILYQFVLSTLTPKDYTLRCNYIYTCTYA